jgi:hypothetical protein
MDNFSWVINARNNSLTSFIYISYISFYVHGVFFFFFFNFKFLNKILFKKNKIIKKKKNHKDTTYEKV